MAFNLAKHVSDGAIRLPEKDVELFLDVDAAVRIRDIDNEIAQIEGAHKGSIAGPPEEATAQLREERNELAERMWSTRIVLHVRMLAPKLTASIQKKGISKKFDDEADRGEWITVELLRHFVTKATYPLTGESQSGPLTFEDFQVFFDSLPDSQAQKLLTEHALLNSSNLRDLRPDAGFPGGATDTAGEPDLSEGDSDSADVESEAV